ncbi:ATP-binding protein [Azospirillum sp. Sh1]|uniref:sensor histidine kinase n=1 Tax=Azospirillum sp. Sh1 TaxID=2607285 RepID=UPI0011EE8E45|nr:ATP-binding protein [Azospirillum sp. Sh1]KAA0569432.1 hypothetical protein FZ029_32545 [Azospirillum sp. Sh1]
MERDVGVLHTGLMTATRRQPLVSLVLMGIPLLVIGILTFQASEADRIVLRAEQADAATARLRLVSDAARSSVERQAAEAVARVASTLSSASDPISALRNLILAQNMGFALVEEGGHRLFPSEDNPEPLLEKRKLHSLLGALAGVRADTAVSAGGQGWAWVADEDGRALLHCRRQLPDRLLCVVLAAAAVDQAVRAALDADPGQSDLWDLSLTDAAGAPVWPEAGIGEEPALAAARLDVPLRGWQAEARRRNGADPGAGRWPMLMAIIAPLLASWVSLGWVVHRAQRMRLEEGRRRMEIAAQVSHDLRTPLANLHLYALLIARKAEDPASIRNYCRIVEEEITRLSLLADNAVAIAKGGAAELTDHGTARPAELVSSILARLRPLLDGAGCTPAVRLGATGSVVFNRAAFERIVTNLLDNARKYAAGSPIDIATWVEGNRLMVSVRDHGPGIPPAAAERAFTPWQQESGSGFGLGLATIRRLARANGGDARIENAAPGTRATAWLRCAPAPGTDGEEPPCTS